MYTKNIYKDESALPFKISYAAVISKISPKTEFNHTTHTAHLSLLFFAVSLRLCAQCTIVSEL